MWELSAISVELAIAARAVLLAVLVTFLSGCSLDHKAATDAPTEIASVLALDLSGGVTMEAVLISPGTFNMGSGRSPFKNEKPVHEVTISQPFYLGRYPVTQEQWQAVMADNPSRSKGAKHPVDGVSWKEAQDFCREVSARTGKIVRLPTEAEWEFACRAGSTADYCFGDDKAILAQYAWYRSNSAGTTHAVGEKKPNAWGLYDMHGNVWQWCQDWYEPECYADSPRVDPAGPVQSNLGAHVLRGGAWHVEASYCRSAQRGGDFPCGEGGPGSWSNADRSGFRVVVQVMGLIQ